MARPRKHNSQAQDWQASSDQGTRLRRDQQIQAACVLSYVMQATGSVCSRQQNSESQAQAARMRAWAWHDAALFLFCSASLLTFVIILLNVWNNSFLLKMELDKELPHLQWVDNAFSIQLPLPQVQVNGGLGTKAPAHPSATQDIPADVQTALRTGQPLHVTFTNGHYSLLMRNWAAHHKKLGLLYVVIALDEEALQLCFEHGINSMTWSENLISGNFREDMETFRKMGAMKPAIVLRFFEQFYLTTVVLSDTDTVWLRDPSDFLKDEPIADLFISTDCLSHEAEERALRGEAVKVSRCGHLPGVVKDQLALNTGIIAFRNRAATKKFLQRWRSYLLDAAKARHIASSGANWTVTDQLALNLLMQEGTDRIVRGVREAGRLVWLADRTVKVLPLPVLAAVNGHVAFEQHLAERHAVSPYVVHATFNRFGLVGKRMRFREMGWWLVDADHYTSTDRNIMTYDNNVAAFIQGLEEAEGHMVLLKKHLLGAAYQVAALRDALAIAWHLNRTLVLPQFLAWCDHDHNADVLGRCATVGSDLQLPFKCPADFYINMRTLPSSELLVRESSFLDKVSTDLFATRQAVTLLDWQTASTEAKPAVAADDTRLLRMGIQAEKLQAVLGWDSDAGILDWPGFQPGAFGGSADPVKTQQFNRLFKAITHGLQWCCSGGSWEIPHQFQASRWLYVQPPPLEVRRAGAAPIPWQVPKLRRPAVCDQLEGENVKFFSIYENHPCRFLPA